MLSSGRIRSSALLATGALLAAACGTTDVPEPAPPAGEADYAIISNPTFSLEAPSGGISGDGQAYVSVLPGTFQAATRIVIRNDRTAKVVEAGPNGGGLDPVGVEASAGDKLDFTVLSADGSAISFARAVPANKRPRVVRVNPPKGRTDVAINASVVVVFSEPVDPATVSGETIRLEKVDGGSIIAGTVTIAGNGLSATYVPSEDLASDTEYRIAVSAEVRDRDGSPVDAPLVSSFRTEGVPTVPTPIPPTLASNVIAFRNYFGGIMLLSGEGGPAVSIFGTSDEDDEPSWSPDGRSLVLSRGRYVGPGELKVLSADGSGNIRHLGEGVDPAWSPDGSRIAFTSYRSGNSEIYLINPDGSGTVQLTDDPADDTSPAWSPDGRHIVFVRDGEIFVMNADGSDARSLGQTGGAPAWSPDGTRIAFDRLVSADWRWDIWVMSSDGSDPRNVTNNAPLITSYGPTWSPDSRRIAFAHARTEEEPYQIYVINADGSGMMHLGPDNPSQGLISSSYAPAWSPR